MTPFQYAKSECQAGRFPSMQIYLALDSFYLCDSDWRILPGGKRYGTRDAAESDRSKILDKASKYI